MLPCCLHGSVPSRSLLYRLRSVRAKDSGEAMATRKKIGLIGAGNIGGELARLCANEELGDVLLYDIPAKENFAKGKALDLEQNGSVLGLRLAHPRHGATGPTSRAPTSSSSRPASRASPGQSRDDLVATNLPIIRDVANNAKKVLPERVRHRHLEPARRDGLRVQARRRRARRSKVVGMAGVLDSARFQLFLAREAGVSVKDVRAMVLGGHGDDMVPVLSMTAPSTACPSPALIAKDKLDDDRRAHAQGRRRDRQPDGHERLLRPGVERGRDGEGVPARPEAAPRVRGVPGRRVRVQGPLHRRPVRHRRQGRREDRPDSPLTEEEKAMLAKSAKSVQAVVDVVKKG